jgi:signal transduction histidine kinase/CheY-like chemotaxis protein
MRSRRRVWRTFVHSDDSHGASRLARVVAWLLVAVLAGLSVAAFVVNRRTVDDQERRLLRERAGEATALLTNAISQTVTSLRLLAVAYGSSKEPGPAFVVAGQTLVRGNVTGVGVARVAAAEVVSGGGAGTIPADGAKLEGGRADVLRRALAAGDLATGLVQDPGAADSRLILAVGAAGVVVYEETRVDPRHPSPRPPTSAFFELQVALYRSPDPDPAQLVVATSSDPSSFSGPVDRRVIPIGSEQWLVVIGADKSLIGSFAAGVPWLILAGGLGATVLTALVVLSLLRWRSYALELVDERTAALRRSVEELQAARGAADAANRSKSEFLSRMSHELRTPLNAVLGFAQLLDLQPLGEEDREAVDQILKGGAHLLELINEVLDISRIETGELALSPEPVLVSGLLGEVSELVRPLAEQRAVQLVGDGQGGCAVFVFADRQRLKQILLNLMSNAVKYNRAGGVVALSCGEPSPTRLRVSVTDTGPGIPAEQLDLLFVPFERLGAERGGVEGTGIGLTISQRLAEAMGGTIQVDSVVGRGSVFSVELPLAEGPIERYERLNGAPPSTAAPLAPTQQRRKVLYIEDNLANLKLVERLVSQRPEIEIVPSMQGSLGVELARQHRPALILLDLHLPDVDGEEILHRLRVDPATASIPVVVISADATPGRVQRLLAGGAIDYLTKPFDVRRLLRLLNDLPPPA